MAAILFTCIARGDRHVLRDDMYAPLFIPTDLNSGVNDDAVVGTPVKKNWNGHVEIGGG